MSKNCISSFETSHNILFTGKLIGLNTLQLLDQNILYSTDLKQVVILYEKNNDKIWSSDLRLF